MGGRYAPSPTEMTTIQYVQIQTLGNAIEFGDLISARNDSGGMSDCVRGICYGGGSINNIEYIHISTLGNAFDFGDAQNAAGYSCNSNGHGGL